DPITAHGLTDALRDAELLTRSLLMTGDAAAYQATRDLLARPFLEATTAIASYAWDLPELMSLHRALRRAVDDEISVLAALDRARGVAAYPPSLGRERDRGPRPGGRTRREERDEVDDHDRGWDRHEYHGERDRRGSRDAEIVGDDPPCVGAGQH